MTLFTREDLIGGLRDLVHELQRAGHPTGLRIIGGGALALRHYDRRTTADIDALRVNPGDEATVTRIVERIAAARGWLRRVLPGDSLSDRAWGMVERILAAGPIEHPSPPGPIEI